MAKNCFVARLGDKKSFRIPAWDMAVVHNRNRQTPLPGQSFHKFTRNVPRLINPPNQLVVHETANAFTDEERKSTFPDGLRTTSTRETTRVPGYPGTRTELPGHDSTNDWRIREKVANGFQDASTA
eukprot:3550647-Rhodomonas_salina.1